jgi:hypothetical protein
LSSPCHMHTVWRIVNSLLAFVSFDWLMVACDIKLGRTAAPTTPKPEWAE